MSQENAHSIRLTDCVRREKLQTQAYRYSQFTRDLCSEEACENTCTQRKNSAVKPVRRRLVRSSTNPCILREHSRHDNFAGQYGFVLDSSRSFQRIGDERGGKSLSNRGSASLSIGSLCERLMYDRRCRMSGFSMLQHTTILWKYNR